MQRDGYLTAIRDARVNRKRRRIRDQELRAVEVRWRGVQEKTHSVKGIAFAIRNGHTDNASPLAYRARLNNVNGWNS